MELKNAVPRIRVLLNSKAYHLGWLKNKPAKRLQT